MGLTFGRVINFTRILDSIHSVITSRVLGTVASVFQARLESVWTQPWKVMQIGSRLNYYRGIVNHTVCSLTPYVQ